MIRMFMSSRDESISNPKNCSNSLIAVVNNLGIFLNWIFGKSG